MNYELKNGGDKMNLNELAAAVEALLFAAGEPVNGEEITDVLQIDEDTLSHVLKKLEEDLEGRGVMLVRAGGEFQLSTRPQYYEYITKMVEPRQRTALSNAALETLSIVAYNQPVTRSSIEYIRGVNSDGAVNRLIERGLIEECGRLDTPGKPLLYKTTTNFLKTFGLTEIEEMPDIGSIPLQLTFYDLAENKDEKL